MIVALLLHAPMINPVMIVALLLHAPMINPVMIAALLEHIRMAHEEQRQVDPDRDLSGQMSAEVRATLLIAEVWNSVKGHTLTGQGHQEIKIEVEIVRMIVVQHQISRKERDRRIPHPVLLRNRRIKG